MSILHYTIGLPPERNGGSVQYAYDLIMAQSKIENIFVLTCGDPLFRRGKTRIKAKQKKDGVPVFTLTNPLTPTLIYGVSNPNSQHRDVKIDYDNIRHFIESNDITVMHLHTLMGLHSNIIEFIKGLGVKIIYTTHDFHGICLHYNLIDPQGNLCEKIDITKCLNCNCHEPSDIFLRIANSSIYHTVKKTGIFNVVKKPKAHITKSGNASKALVNKITNNKILEYENLIKYYNEYFKLIDKFHFNSSQTEKVFKRFLPNIEGKVIPVITSGIKDRRKKLCLSKNIKLGFIGSLQEYKGFPILKRLLLELYNEGYNNFKLITYSGNRIGIDADCPLIEYKPSYSYSEISEIMYGLDCVIIPSKWYETFSLVALEALAHGRPVIVSNHVGAKDIVAKFFPELIYDTTEKLKRLLRQTLDHPDRLNEYNNKLCAKTWGYSIENHSKDLIEYYHE